jgi:hypothetical protein
MRPTPAQYSDAARLHLAQEMRGVLNGFLNRSTSQKERDILRRIQTNLDALAEQEKGCVMVPSSAHRIEKKSFVASSTAVTGAVEP